jgi:hypothetical protein
LNVSGLAIWVRWMSSPPMHTVGRVGHVGQLLLYVKEKGKKMFQEDRMEQVTRW